MTDFSARLLHVKGKRTVIINEVKVTWESLNNGDSFILDLGRKLICWMGEESNRSECINALKFMNKLRVTERASNATLYVIKQNDNINFTNDDNIEEIKTLFWKTLGISTGKEPSNIKTDKEGGDDDLIVASNKILFFQVEEDNDFTLKELNNIPLKRTDLNPENTYIICFSNKSYIWIGKKSEIGKKYHLLAEWYSKFNEGKA